MAMLTPEGEKIVGALAEQYKIGADTVKTMLDAMAKGGGSVARFDAPEFGGSVEWMRGGSAIFGDMAGNAMKATVDNLCNDLSNLLASQASLAEASLSQASLFAPMGQPQSCGNGADCAGKEGAGASPTASPYGWWPAELGEPSLAGSRNACRYAYFAGIRRLAVDLAGHIEVYDTTGFNIEGIASQQGREGAAPVFASNRGPVRLNSFPRDYGIEAETRTAPEGKSAAARTAPAQKPAPADAGSILALIEQLGGLRDKGILTEEEFAAKKAELLNRL